MLFVSVSTDRAHRNYLVFPEGRGACRYWTNANLQAC